MEDGAQSNGDGTYSKEDGADGNKAALRCGLTDTYIYHGRYGENAPASTTTSARSTVALRR